MSEIINAAFRFSLGLLGNQNNDEYKNREESYLKYYKMYVSRTLYLITITIKYTTYLELYIKLMLNNVLYIMRTFKVLLMYIL